LTAPAVTPSASAIACWLQPFAFNAHARSRRPSRQSAGPRSCGSILHSAAQSRPPLAARAEISRIFDGHTSPVLAVTWGTDWRHAFSGDSAGGIRVWDLSD